VLNFRYEDDDLIEHRYLLREATTGKIMTDKLKFVFVEVEKFNKSEDELAPDFDKWLFILKNLSKLLERPAALRDKIFSRLFDVAEYASLDNIDKQNYVKAMTPARDTHNQIEYAKKTGLEEGLVKGFEKGRAEGLEEGLEKGREDAKQLIAINFLKLGTPCEVVAKATGLSLEEVIKIKDSSGR
ncbi:MAG: PD-(D/E)XK nuclease family transposase, partial [Bacteroidales bacterium]|nr:PD-(D/E)XK nuclease family transposase [Bacteroidales bacterium]